MGVRISSKFAEGMGAADMQKFVRQRMAALQHWATPLHVIAAVMYRGVMLNFRSQGGRIISGGWAPLSPVTIARRTKGSGTGSARILQDKGMLMLNVNPGSDNDEATTTSNLPYSAAMQNGLPRRPGFVKEYTRANGVRVRAHATTLPAVPARPYMVLNEYDKDSIKRIALLWLQGKGDFSE